MTSLSTLHSHVTCPPFVRPDISANSRHSSPGRTYYQSQKSNFFSQRYAPRRLRVCRMALGEEVEQPVPKVDVAKELSQLKKSERNGKSGTRRRADSTDGISSALSRRFGLAGGLAWFGFLAFGVISEQVKTRLEVYNEEQGSKTIDTAEEVFLPGGTKYKDLRVGGGSSPTLRDLVIVSVVGTVQGEDTPFIDTTANKRDLVFTFGGRPFVGGICEGLEAAVRNMKTGGRRQVFVPPSQGFGEEGLQLGSGRIVQTNASLEYIVELKRVSIPPS